MNDKTHLTHKATDKLSQNLKLNTKDGYKSVCNNKQHKRSKDAPQETPSTPVGNNVDVSHSFWSHAARKVTPKQRPATNRQPRRPQTYTPAITETDYINDNRCYNCYETNHTVNTCRHEGPIVCNRCGEEGHKSKHHSY